MHFPLIMFGLACIGLLETSYLIHMRRKEEKPICPIGNDCHVVLSSKYNRLMGVHNDVLGFTFYLAAAVLSLQTNAILVRGFAAMLIFGSVFSLGLVFIQWRLVKAWCFWCLMSSCTIWTMTFLYLYAILSSI